jgi:hypothetical protein
MIWRQAADFATNGGLLSAGDRGVARSVEFVLFPMHRLCARGRACERIPVPAERPAGFGLLQEGMTPHRFAAVPFLVFAAPFIIMRNTLRGIQIERRRFEFVMLATVIAGFWSMMSGTFFLMTLRAAGVLV